MKKSPKNGDEHIENRGGWEFGTKYKKTVRRMQISRKIKHFDRDENLEKMGDVDKNQKLRITPKIDRK